MRNLAQYFYPQRQTKVMNEGCATFVHYTIMNRLYDRGLITEGAMLEFLHSHANVVFQPDFDDPRYGGINPYALGFAMMQDIQRICVAPTDEDRDWFPDIAGSGDWRAVLRDAWANYRDESFVRQFLGAEADAQFPAVRALRQGRRAELQGRGDPRRARAIAACARRSPTATMSARTSRTSRSSTSISSATGHLCCATRYATASASPKPAARRRCATSAACGATRCGLRRRRLRQALELTAPDAVSRPASASGSIHQPAWR